MYTSLNASRQSLLPPFIHALNESSQFHPYFHLHAPGMQTYVQYMQIDRHCQLSPLSPRPCTVVSSIIQPVNAFKVHAHVQTHTFGCNCSLSPTVPLRLSFAYNIHRAGGQRSLLYIRSASSISDRHQSRPQYQCLYNNEMKRTMRDNNTCWLTGNRLSLRKAWQRSAF